MRERSATRVVPRSPVTVVIDNPKRPSAYGVVANISELGGCVLTAETYDVGEDVTLTLSFPREPQPIQTPGHVVWSGEGPKGTVRYGLKFDTTLDVHVKLKDLIEHSGS